MIKMKKFLLSAFIILTLFALTLVLDQFVVVKKEKYLRQNEQYRIDQEDKKIGEAFHEKFLGVLVKDEDGTEALVDPKDFWPIFSVFQYGSFEHYVNNVLKQIVKSGQRVVSLGGRMAFQASLISDLVGEKGKVFVFNADPRMAKIYRGTINFAKKKNIVFFEKEAYSRNMKVRFAACSPDADGRSHILQAEDKVGKNFDEITVEAVALDSIQELDNTIDILHMDIGDGEDEAVYGAKKLIDNSHNLIVVQSWYVQNVANERTSKYIKFWRDRGYKFGEIQPSGEVIVEKTDDELMLLPYTDIIIAKNLDEIISKFKPDAKPEKQKV